MTFKEKVYEFVSKKEKKFVEIPELKETVYFTPLTVLEMQVIRTRSEIPGPGSCRE